jgi:hypothetical protein
MSNSLRSNIQSRIKRENSAQRITRLAEIVSIDPTWLERYEEALRQKERIRQNQAVGASVEALFKRAFLTPDVAALGIRIERTGWGSDFCIEHDLIENNGEIAFRLQAGGHQGFLIELKSTFGSVVSMSRGQGTQAAERPDSFALCVVQLDDGAADPALIREKARFVPEIGHLLKPRVDELTAVESLFDDVPLLVDGIEILREGGDLHYRVREAVWASGLTFDQFVERLLRFFAS